MYTLRSKYYCYGGYTGWVVLDMITLSFQLFPALNPNFICNGMATDHITRTVICTSLGQTTSWCSCARARKCRARARLLTLQRVQVAAGFAARFGTRQHVSQPPRHHR